MLCLGFQLELVILDEAGVVSIDDLKERIDELPLNGDSQFSDKVSHLIKSQRLRSIQIEVIEDFSKKVGIILRQLKDSRLDLAVTTSGQSFMSFLFLEADVILELLKTPPPEESFPLNPVSQVILDSYWLCIKSNYLNITRYLYRF